MKMTSVASAFGSSFSGFAGPVPFNMPISSTPSLALFVPSPSPSLRADRCRIEWIVWGGGEGCRSFEMVILPLSILQRTSHQDGRSAKAGLQTPATNPGLEEHPGGDRQS